MMAGRQFQAYRSGQRVRCGRCHNPFPVEIVSVRHSFGEFEKGDNLVWSGKWLYSEGLLRPHDELLELIRFGRDVDSRRRTLLPIGQGLEYKAKRVRCSGCPRLAVCPRCLAQNIFDAAYLHVSSREPATRGAQ